MNCCPYPKIGAKALEDGERLTVGTRTLTVRHTRGHADHHACYYDEQTRSWFTGDMFGVSYPHQRYPSGNFVMPATTPTQFDPDRYIASVQGLARDEPKRMYLTHYGALDLAGGEVELLVSQLSAYAELGSQEGLEPADIERAVMDVTRTHLEQRVSVTAAKEALEPLRMDARLNAQGIAWWRSRR